MSFHVISYHDKPWVLLAYDDGISVDMDLHQLGDGAHLLILVVILHYNTKRIQIIIVVADAGHLVHTGALEIKVLSVEGQVVGVSRHHAHGTSLRWENTWSC